MLIRHLIGPRKGQVEDVIFDRARAKVLSGEAEDVDGQLHMLSPEVRSERVDVIEPMAVQSADIINKLKKKVRR